MTPVILLIVFGALAVAWSESRSAAELAQHYGRETCARAGVQWLDQTVALSKLGLRRGSDGRLRVYREYRFEYSWEGHDRHPGGLALVGKELLWISVPSRELPPA